MAASFGAGVQLARLLGVNGYGYYGMALAVITVAGIPGEMGLPRLVTREIAAAISTDDMPRLFGVVRWADSWAWRTSALLALIVAAAAFVLSRDHPTGLALSLLLGVPVIPLLALARIRGGALQGLHHIVLGQVPDTLVRPLLLSVLLALGSLSGVAFGAPQAMALNSVTAAAAFVLAQAWLARRLPAKRPAELVHGGRGWLASSVPMALTDGMRILQAEVSVLLLGFLAAPVDVGLFRIANVTSFAAATPAPIITFVAFPVIAGLYAEKDMLRLQRVITIFAWLQFVGVLLLCAPLIVFPEPLLKLVYGSGYVDAADPLRILAAAQIVTAGFGTNAALLNMTHHERRVTRAMSIALVLNLAAVTVLSIVWGRVGAALGFAAALICWNILTWHDARRLLGIETSILPFGRWPRLENHRASMRNARRSPSSRGSRRKPNFFIAGAPKCGTTAWTTYLASHPSVYFSEVKEPCFFALDMPKIRLIDQMDEYERLFRKASGQSVIGEASTAYFYSSRAAEAIQKYNPDSKIIIFIRDQEDFLPSLHHQLLYSFDENIRDFALAWQLSGRRSPDEVPRTCRDPKLLDYVRHGRFSEHVGRYFAVFPPEQIRVIHFDSWTRDPRRTYLEILDFLQLEDDGRTDFPRVNEAKSHRSELVARLVMDPPRVALKVAATVKELTGQSTLKWMERASKWIEVPGYTTQISEELRRTLRQFYEEENRRLDGMLAQADAVEERCR